MNNDPTMSSDRATCDPRRIELFLRQKLSDDEQSAFERHLDDCHDCQRELDAAAADADVWSGIRESLRAESSEQSCSMDAESDDLTGKETSFDHATVLRMLAPTDDERMLGRLGPYDVVGVIGSGGMGIVLKAFDAALNRYVAVKVLAPHLGHIGAARRRFSREAQAAAAVVHDNVMEIHGVADLTGLPYLVMPYVRGPSLQRRLDDGGPLALVEILRIGMQAAFGLAAAHAQGLVHRDVKPANIMLADGIERVKLTDFGLARAADDASLTKTGIIAGTPQYMSPEQARGESVDQRSDLFSLGSVLYAMCTGRAPFRAETSYGVLRCVTDDEPRSIRELNPEIPEWLCRIVARLMSKQPDDRFESAREVAELLEACLAHVQQPTVVLLPVSLVPKPPFLRVFPLSRRSVGVILMLATASLAILVTALWQAADLPDARPTQPTADAAAAAPKATNAAAPAATQAASVPAPIGPGTARQLKQFNSLTTGHDVKVACSPFGQWIVVANGNPTLTMLGNGRSQVSDGWKPAVDVLNASTGELLVPLSILTEDEEAILTATDRVSHAEPQAVAFSPDGKLIAVGTSIGQVKLFNAGTGELIVSLDDEAPRLADKKTPENWKPLKRGMGSVTALAFSPDSSMLAVCGSSYADFSERFDGIERMGFRVTGPGRLKVWDTATGQFKFDLPGHNDHANAVAFSPDGHYLASAGRWMSDGDWGNGVLIWNAQTGQAVHSLIRSTANGGVRSVAFSPDSEKIVIGTQRFGESRSGDSSTGGVSVIGVSSAVEDWLVTVPGWASAVSFTPDGKQIAVLCGGKSVRLLDVESGATKSEIRAAADDGVRWSDFSLAARADLLAVGHVGKARQIGLETWSLGNADLTKNSTTESPLKMADAQTNKIRSFATSKPIQTVACSPDGTLIAVANRSPKDSSGQSDELAEPTVEIIDAQTEKSLLSLNLATEDVKAVNSAIAARGYRTNFQVTALALSNNVVAVGTSLGQVRLYAPRTGALIHVLNDVQPPQADDPSPRELQTLPRAIGSVASLAISPDEGQLAVCGSSFEDYAARFGKAREIKELKSGPGRLKVWSILTGRSRHDLVGHSRTTAVTFSPDGKFLASVGRTETAGRSETGAFVWDARTGAKQVMINVNLTGSAQSVAISPDGKRIVIGTRHEDVDQGNPAGQYVMTLARLESGVTDWQRPIRASVQRIAFYDHSVLALCDQKSMQFFDQDSGNTQMVLNRPDSGPVQWADFAQCKQGHMWVIAGETADHLGSLEILDSDHARSSRLVQP